MKTIREQTKIASEFEVRDYKLIRPTLLADDGAAWTSILNVFRRRLDERFLSPVEVILKSSNHSLPPLRPGAVVVAIDCLLIDTIQSFREGRLATSETSPAKSFNKFLKAPRFGVFSSADRADFFTHIRNGLLHNGETRRDWILLIGKKGSKILEKTTARGRTLNYPHFHKAILDEIEDYVNYLKAGNGRKEFIQRMDSICGIKTDTRPDTPRTYCAQEVDAIYFQYEQLRTAVSKNRKFGFDADWCTFCKILSMLSIKARGTRLQNRLSHLNEFTAVPANLNRGDVITTDGKYVEIKCTILTASHKKATIRNIREWQKLDAYLIVVVDLRIAKEPKTYVFWLAESQMTNELLLLKATPVSGTKLANFGSTNIPVGFNMDVNLSNIHFKRWVDNYSYLKCKLEQEE